MYFPNIFCEMIELWFTICTQSEKPDLRFSLVCHNSLQKHDYVVH